ncbi:MAG: quinone-dependent dihydroorotate dehydrogenase [Paracoccaceae bacterium]
MIARALHLLEPERAHGLALTALRAGLGPRGGPVTGARLATTVAGIALPNPVGLAAGFDKDAVALGALHRAGFGFVEVGAVTPRAQEGNGRPRLFRLGEDRAAINRFGFNNAGMEAMAERLEGRGPGVIGLNLGANKDSADRAADFATVLRRLGGLVDFATVNVSSPNTEALRDLQGAEALRALLDGAMAVGAPCPVLLKIAPDLTDAEIGQIAAVAEGAGIAGIVATNTTTARDGLRSAHRDQAGGLSGRPLFARATRVLARLAAETRLPLIGVGGVEDAETAYAKIRAGASAVQLYTAMVWAGPGLGRDIARGLDGLLARDGFASVGDAVGVDRARLA